MYHGEFGEIEQCYECGSELAYRDIQAFQIDADRVLCAVCATRRGGVYDGTEGRWIHAPSLRDLADEHTEEIESRRPSEHPRS